MAKIIDDQLGNNILNYLAKHPYIEVYQLIQGLQNIPEFTPPPKEENKNV